MKWYKKVGIAGLTALTMGLAGCPNNQNIDNQNIEHQQENLEEAIQKSTDKKSNVEYISTFHY